MPEPALYNSRIINTFIEFLKNTVPEINISELLEQSAISLFEIADEGHWLTQKQVDSFHDALMRQANDFSLFREAGRYMVYSKSIAIVRQFIIGFLTPIHAYTMLEKINSYINRAATYEAKKISSNKVEIISKPNAGVTEKPYQCENRKGAFEAVAKLFTNKLPLLEHPVCLHQGGTHCQYVISWIEPAFLKWKRIRSYFILSSILLVLIANHLLPPFPVVLLASVLIGVIMGTSQYSDYAEKKDIYAKIEMQGNAANQLLDQITIGYNNVLLVQEIGQAVSSILHIDELLKFVMDTLQKRLDFDRGMIMLADPERTKLVYMSGFGYNPAHEELLKRTSFHLDSPQSRGQFVKAFKEQKPSLIENITDLRTELSARSYEFAKALEVKSFICVPIVYEGQSQGILAVDNLRSNRPLSQSDVSLLMGIAPQIGISINNAKSLQQIRESEERFRTLSENSPDIIYTLDINGGLTYINSAGENILGYRREEILGRFLLDLVRKEDAETYLQLLEKIKDGKETIKNFKGILLSKDGAERLFAISGAPNFDADGTMIGIVGTLKDFTEQHNLEKQLQETSKMKALGTLTGGISHDFNNIVQAISGYNQLLMMKKRQTDPDWKHLVSIGNLTQRATDLIKQLLLFSRKVESKLVPLDLNEEIKKFYSLLVGTLPKTIRVETEMADDLHIISGDASQLGQVIMNLIVNAKDAIPEGGQITIHTENVVIDGPYYIGDAQIKAGDYVRLSISDTGYGMDKETLKHVFEPFFTTKEAGKGTGIGLSVVYGVIKNHNAYIFCDSEPGKGTTFDLYLPALNSTGLERDKQEETEAEAYEGHETILLIDDEMDLLETGSELLAFSGYHVLTAQSGEEALSMIARDREDISLVILDLMMPGMGGLKCLGEILKLAPAMKVIVASGYTANLKIQEMTRQGAAAIIQKPYRFEVLSKKIREVLDGKDQPDEGRRPLPRINGV